MTRWRPHRRGRAGLARTFQHSRSFRGLSVRENVEVAALGVGAGPREARRRADALLESLALGGYAAAPAGSLPHGDERRLGVARALATEPRFLLMDEPAAGLPEAEVPAFAEVVRSVRDDHDAGVLLIDHNMALIMDVCDRIQVLDQGRTLAEGSPGEIRGNLDVASAYLGESAVTGMTALLIRGSRGRVRRRRRRTRRVAGGRAGRDRRSHRPERRRQVHHPARDHGTRPGARRRHPARRAVASREDPGGSRTERGRARPGGSPAVRGAHGRREPPARTRRPGELGGRGRGSRGDLRAVPRVRGVPATGMPGPCPAGSSSNSRSRGP